MKQCPVFLFMLVCLSCKNKNEMAINEKRNYHSMLDLEKSFKVQDTKGNEHEILKLTEEEFKKHIEKGIKRDDEFYNQYKVDLYEAASDSIIVKQGGDVLLYPSKNLVIDLLESSKNKSSSKPILYNRNPYGKDFPEHVDGLVKKMLTDLEIPSDEIINEQLLKNLDKKIVEKRNTDFFNKYYLSFIAFVGELVIQKHSGNWKMVLANEGVTWSPCININGVDIFFADYILIDVYNLQLKKPLEESYESVLGIAKFNKDK